MPINTDSVWNRAWDTVTGSTKQSVGSFGSGAEQARIAGADLEQQAAYGLASAVTNVAGKKLMNVATPFRYAFGPGILDEAVSELVGKLADTKTGRIVLSALSEGGEELAQSIVLPILQRAMYDPMAAFDLGDTMYQTAIGTITGDLAAVSTHSPNQIPS